MDEVTVFLSLNVTVDLSHLHLDLCLALVVLDCDLPEDLLAHVVLGTVEIVNRVFVEDEDGKERSGNVADQVKVKKNSPICELSVYGSYPHFRASRT